MRHSCGDIEPFVRWPRLYSRVRRLVARAPRIAVAALLTLAVAACAGRTAANQQQALLQQPFAYPPRPLAVIDRGTIAADATVAVHDLSYRSPLGGRVPAYLVTPIGNLRRAAIILMHGTPGDRTSLLGLAVAYARRGAIALTISSPLARRHLPPLRLRRLVEARLAIARERQTIIDLRRAIDLLQTRPDVDPRRIGFVGFSTGAIDGGILCGVDHRLRAAALMSGGVLVPRDLELLPPAQRRPAAELLQLVNVRNYLPHARPVRLLFQYGRFDRLLTRAELLPFVRAGSQPKTIRSYPTDHALNQTAIHEQMRWLAAQLTLPRTQ